MNKKTQAISEQASIDPMLLEAFQDAADTSGFMSFAAFMRIVLYHPQRGYYARNKERVGRNANTDFYTSSSFRELFASILIEASASLLAQAGQSAADYGWLEIGAEPDKALLSNRDTPFAATRALRLGDPIEVEGKWIVFSNELFDAQPFHRVAFRDGTWQERGVTLKEGWLENTFRPRLSPEAEQHCPALPPQAPEGYCVDLPTEANALLDKIASQPWQGLFIAFDYGKTWQALAYDTPQGTARAYRKHQQVSDLLKDPGEQDLTCHICWDWLEAALKENRFENLQLLTQEAFVIRNAPEVLKAAFDDNESSLSPLRSQLKQLIHPSLMGQAFQALTAIRK